MPEEKSIIIHPKDKQTFDDLIKSDKPTLVDFFATWCGPCSMMSMILDDFTQSYKNIDKVQIVKIDIDELSDVAAEFGVMSVPTLKFFQQGKELETMVGMRNEEDLADKLDELLK